MKSIIKSLIFSVIILFIVAINEVNAATASITATKTNATVGENVTITVSINAAAWNIKVSGSGINDTIAGYNDDAVNESKTKTYTLNTSTAGTYTVSITGDITDESKEYADKLSGKSVTVTVSEPIQQPEPPPTPSTNTGSSSGSNNSSSSNSSSNSNSSSSSNTTTVKKSSNSDLSSLEIAEGVITPEFSSSVTEYEISVPNEITKLNISAEADSSKATVKITGNEELQVGENTIEVVVTAEDGSKTTYTILAKRAQPELSLHALTVSYIDENGEKIDLILNPAFIFNVYEYNIDTILPDTVSSLEVLGAANRENAVIEVIGNEDLKEGKNEITVKVTVTNEAGLEEQKTYKIIVEKEKEEVVASLTLMEKISKWFSGIGSTISAWTSENFNKIITGMLIVATVTFIGLTIYFVYDYKNYKKLLAKLAEFNKENLMERANVALDPEVAKNTVKEENNIENIETNNIEEIENDTEEPAIKLGRGRRFK